MLLALDNWIVVSTHHMNTRNVGYLDKRDTIFQYLFWHNFKLQNSNWYLSNSIICTNIFFSSSSLFRPNQMNMAFEHVFWFVPIFPHWIRINGEQTKTYLSAIKNLERMASQAKATVSGFLKNPVFIVVSTTIWTLSLKPDLNCLYSYFIDHKKKDTFAAFLLETFYSQHLRNGASSRKEFRLRIGDCSPVCRLSRQKPFGIPLNSANLIAIGKCYIYVTFITNVSVCLHVKMGSV